MRLCKHCCKSDSVQLSSELQPFLRVRPCNPVPPSNHQSSRHTSSRPDARTQPPPFSDHRAPAPQQQPALGELYPRPCFVSSHLFPDTSNPTWSLTPFPGSQVTSWSQLGGLHFHDKGPITLWHVPTAPDMPPHFSFKSLRGFSRVHGPVTHLAGPGGGERFRFPGSELLPPGLSAPHRKHCSALWVWEVGRWGRWGRCRRAGGERGEG